MKQSRTKKVYIYPIKDTDGSSLDLINVLTYVPDHSTGSNVLDRVGLLVPRTITEILQHWCHVAFVKGDIGATHHYGEG